MAKVTAVSVMALALTAHFAIVGISAAKTPIDTALGKSTLSSYLVVYAYLSGAGNHFGFFAPGVTSQFRIAYQLRRGGQPAGAGTITTTDPETTFRIHNIVQQFWPASGKPDLRRSLAASLAGKLLAENPEADEVELSVDAYVLPSMAEYRAGERPSWETHYKGTFDARSEAKAI